MRATTTGKTPEVRATSYSQTPVPDGQQEGWEQSRQTQTKKQVAPPPTNAGKKKAKKPREAPPKQPDQKEILDKTSEGFSLQVGTRSLGTTSGSAQAAATIGAHFRNGAFSASVNVPVASTGSNNFSNTLMRVDASVGIGATDTLEIGATGVYDGQKGAVMGHIRNRIPINKDHDLSIGASVGVRSDGALIWGAQLAFSIL